jgi:hypothetical protein
MQCRHHIEHQTNRVAQHKQAPVERGTAHTYNLSNIRGSSRHRKHASIMCTRHVLHSLQQHRRLQQCSWHVLYSSLDDNTLLPIGFDNVPEPQPVSLPAATST